MQISVNINNLFSSHKSNEQSFLTLPIIFPLWLGEPILCPKNLKFWLYNLQILTYKFSAFATAK